MKSNTVSVEPDEKAGISSIPKAVGARLSEVENPYATHAVIILSPSTCFEGIVAN